MYTPLSRHCMESAGEKKKKKKKKKEEEEEEERKESNEKRKERRKGKREKKRKRKSQGGEKRVRRQEKELYFTNKSAAFLSYLRLSINMAVISVAITMSFHLKQQPSTLELKIAKPLGTIFWVLAFLTFIIGAGNYISECPSSPPFATLVRVVYILIVKKP